MIFKYASTLILLLPSLALNSRIRDPSTYAFQAQKLAIVTGSPSNEPNLGKNHPLGTLKFYPTNYLKIK